MVQFQIALLAFASLTSVCHSFHLMSMPCNVSLSPTCPASLNFIPSETRTIEETASLFNVNPDSVNKTGTGFLISVNCSCPAGHDEFTWHTDYTIRSGDTWGKISSEFGSLAVEKTEKLLIPLRTVALDILCGCSEGKHLVTYVIKRGDTLFTICSIFKCNVTETQRLNRIDDSAIIHLGDVIFIPTKDLGNLLVNDTELADPIRKTSKSQGHLVVGIIAAFSAVVIVIAAFLFWLYFLRKKRIGLSESSAGGRKLPQYFFSGSKNGALQDPRSLSRESMRSAMSFVSSRNASIFEYYEVRDATSNFSPSRKLGQGSYGSVYLGRLNGRAVAVKQMKNTKSKEFLAELNILRKVHHTNLIELIGYAAGGEYLFLVYEFAANGALSDHVHDPAAKGHAPLSWLARVQIALDAARGLEYIHLHTKPYYVHRDVKTSNILLDSNLRAKIADFGLVKLLQHSPEIGDATSKIVGTFGYLAPEYVRDGCVTTKSDVYAYGVVLMELITGRPALSRSILIEDDLYAENRSVVNFVLSALEDNDNAVSRLKECVDPCLTHYHKESLVQMALLAKDCVDENRNRRPDMSKMVVCLSLILESCTEWEAQGEDLPSFSVLSSPYLSSLSNKSKNDKGENLLFWH